MFWWCFLVSIAAGFVLGGLTERLLVRPLYGKPEINPIVVMVGLLICIEAVVGAIWGTTARPIPPPSRSSTIYVKGHPIALSPLSVFQIVAARSCAL